MKFSPGFHQSLLAARQIASDQFNGINAEDSFIFHVIRVEMSAVMRRARFHVHPYNDPEKSA